MTLGSKTAYFPACGHRTFLTLSKESFRLSENLSWLPHIERLLVAHSSALQILANRHDPVFSRNYFKRRPQISAFTTGDGQMRCFAHPNSPNIVFKQGKLHF